MCEQRQPPGLTTGQLKRKITMQLKTQYPQTILVRVTPEMAAEWLTRNTNNRQPRAQHIETLAGAMARGEWLITNNGIGFDINGNLRDGQHRLMAIVASGVTIEIMVTTGLPVNAYEVIDCGAARSLADRTEWSQKEAAVLNLAATLFEGVARRQTIPQLRRLADAGFYKAITGLFNACNATRAIYSTAIMQLAACTLIVDGRNPDYIHQQYKALVNRDYGSMSNSSQAFCKQIENQTIKASPKSRDLSLLARGLYVFDETKKESNRVTVTDESKTKALEYFRFVCNAAINRSGNA